ncbi:MAG: AraC family transcriptional regulator [Rhodospirillaceae bacterium]|nr:AraC family transcriptional regulator [Rhodospirillaceae bacterium]
MASLKLPAPGAGASKTTTTSGSGSPLGAVERACRFIEGRVEAGERFTLAELGAHCGLSPWHLQRQFRQVMGVTPHDYGDQRRLGRFRDELQQGEGVAAATYGAGYGSSSRVYERADGLIGMTPATYAKGGKGAVITYGIADSQLGRLLAAATPRGICFVGLGDEDAGLEAELRGDFWAADSIRRDDGELGRALQALLDFLAGKEPHVELPLDIRATAFQRRVWQELRRIPLGETRSYGEIARALGQETASRAVGRACATNPVSLIVPCHRARGQDGALTGYRWGIQRKAALLERESAMRSRKKIL